MDALRKEIAAVLPPKKWRVIYLQLDAVQVKPLILKSPRPDSFKIRHYLELLTMDNVVVMGIEIFVYLQVYNDRFEQYIFVPKCDTVGLEKLDFQVGRLVQVFLQWVLNYSPNNYLITQQKRPKDTSNPTSTEPETVYRIRQLQKLLDNDSLLAQRWNTYPKFKEDFDNKKSRITLPAKRKLHIAFFTKASPLYLFPNLDRNPNKQVASGPKLLRWWMRIVGKVTKDQTWNRFLDIPGADANEIAKYLGNEWRHGNIFDKDRLAVNAIPLFPDDPKGRFLEHLIVEGRHSKMTAKSFYYEIGFRQEFRLGDVVGLIGCTNAEEEFVTSTSENSISTILLSAYKKFIKDTKSIDYSNRAEVIMATKSILEGVKGITDLMGLWTQPLEGPLQKPNVNDITNAVRKRTPNDLTAQIRKKPKK